jgi:hypothetical protein
MKAQQLRIRSLRNRDSGEEPHTYLRVATLAALRGADGLLLHQLA